MYIRRFFFTRLHTRGKKNGDSNNTDINNNNPNEWSHRIMKSEERTEPRSSVFKLTTYSGGQFLYCFAVEVPIFFRNRSNRRVQRDSPIVDGVSYIRKIGEDLLLSCVPFISVISILFFLSTKRKDE